MLDINPKIYVLILSIFYVKDNVFFQQRKEYSCRLPDAFKTPSEICSGATNCCDGDVGEVNLADMNPEDIRAELKRYERKAF